nr:MAG TPA: hypothetical protein [Caudoviricetes sp.]
MLRNCMKQLQWHFEKKTTAVIMILVLMSCA